MKDQLNIALVQTDLHWEDRNMNLDHIANLIAPVNGSDIILLPETFTSGFSMKRSVAESDSVTLDWMKKIASSKGSAVAGSFFVNDNDKCYNRFHFVEPDGKVTIYNKRHLFRLTNEQDVFTSGAEQVIVNYLGWKIAVFVCYDLRFPVWIRRTESNDYDLILLVANWPDRRTYAWHQLLIARAIENQSYVAAVNRIGKDGTGISYEGDSLGIDPMGKIITQGTPFTEGVFHFKPEYSTLQSVRKNLPFSEDRDSFQLII
jgi:omega-amidase